MITARRHIDARAFLYARQNTHTHTHNLYIYTPTHIIIASSHHIIMCPRVCIEMTQFVPIVLVVCMVWCAIHVSSGETRTFAFLCAMLDGFLKDARNDGWLSVRV